MILKPNDMFVERAKVYVAAPWFTPEQDERERWLVNFLKIKQHDVFSPRDASNITGTTPTKEERQYTFEQNIANLDSCDFVVAITDGKDVGTIWECGYAYAMEKPIIYFAETLGNNPFNLMLAESGIAVIKDRKAFESMPDLWDIWAEFVRTGDRYAHHYGAIE